MADVTVSQLADTIGTPVDRLLQQLQAAGLHQTKPGDPVSEGEKQTLLVNIKKHHGESESSPKKITLKRRTLSTLKTGGSAGRGRTVNVEVRKKRTYVRKTDANGVSDVNSPADADARPAEKLKKIQLDGSAEATAEPEYEAVDSGAAEAIEVAVEKEQPEPPVLDEAARRKAALAEMEAEASRRRQETVKRSAEAEAKLKAVEEEKEALVKKQAADVAAKKKKELEVTKISDRKDKRDRHDLDEKDSREKRSKHGSKRRRSEELKGSDDSGVSRRAGKPLGLSRTRARRPSRSRGHQHQFKAPTEVAVREIELPESISVSQLSQKISVKASEVIKSLMGLGVMANINQTVEQDVAAMIVEEFGHTAKYISADALEESLISEEMTLDGDAEVRAPVVTVMGHVDHGKTSLLDFIRKADVVSGEAGGITQHIGAYRVATGHGEICFIDTPGHAAFSAMRSRGANSTDIVILVVAADDGVMPQTEEAVKHAKAAGVPMVVAVNKIDKEGADPERVKNELAARDVIPDGWGGDTQFVSVSALTGAGVDELLEAVLLQAELLELSAVVDGPAHGVVVESELSKGRGSVATLLIQNGTLKKGDVIVAGEKYGRVRAINNDREQVVKTAGPATPVTILGLNGPPAAGESFVVVKDEKRAREVADFRQQKADDERLATPAASLDNLLESFGSQNISCLNVVVKADVRGTLEAIVSALNDLGNDEVKVNIVYSGVGAIAEHDANFAVTAGAVVFGFNVRADSAARKKIEAESIDLRYYKVIYDLVDDVRAALSGMLSPEIREEIVGIAEVRDVFESKQLGTIAGCMVIEGTVYKQKKIRVLRDNIVIYEGELESLRHYKAEVESARNGTECGIGVKNYNDVKVGDQIEVFEPREVAREL
ncbi:MAG: translation initiation factor IF-2 [Pseudomonadales bacterium]|nr:translation initiation factor IF-2 [Pseudomonadales bacterium]